MSEYLPENEKFQKIAEEMRRLGKNMAKLPDLPRPDMARVRQFTHSVSYNVHGFDSPILSVDVFWRVCCTYSLVLLPADYRIVKMSFLS
mgnify:CR=1 FL=1